MKQPTDYDRLETLTAEQLEAKPKLFRILCPARLAFAGRLTSLPISELLTLCPSTWRA